MRSVDTNVLLRMVVRDDPQQAAAADSFVSKGAWVSQLVLAEAVWAMRSVYQLTHTEVADVIELLLDHEHLVWQEPEVIASALATFRSRPALGFPDCLIFEIARKAGHIPLGTFDRGLAKLTGTEKLDSK